MTTTATVAVTTVGPPSAPPHTSEEDIAKKKNTDCVYFLASPLTCKKGDECEFRHSESARLNPRDCWYWVGGNCRNRECPFRHPPIETRPAAAPPPTPPAHQKKPVPCFFFSQGCCAKGTKCQFLHEGPASNAMVYRLSDTSKPAAHDSSKPKVDSAAEATQQQQGSTGSQAPDKRKDNVYRLQDPKKGKVAAGPSRESSEDLNNDQSARDSRSRISKAHKESFTWKLSDSPAAQKQPAAQSSDASPPQRKPEKQSRKSSSSSSEPDRKRRDSDRGDDNEIVAEDFAAPKSLAQIKEEKRKNEDLEDEPGSAFKAKRKPSDQGGGGVRRKLCNGSSSGAHDGDGGGEDDGGGDGEGDSGGDGEGVAGMEINGVDDASKDVDAEEFARKLAALL